MISGNPKSRSDMKSINCIKSATIRQHRSLCTNRLHVPTFLSALQLPPHQGLVPASSYTSLRDVTNMSVSLTNMVCREKRLRTTVLSEKKENSTVPILR